MIREFNFVLSSLLLARAIQSITVNMDVVEQITSGNHPMVKLLDTQSFEPFVSAPDQINAVMFVAPWCFVCPIMLPMWADAAQLLQTSKPSEASKNANVHMAVIDVTKNPEIAEQNNIHAFPTLKLFVDNEVFIYTHEAVDQPFSPSIVVNWVNRHTNRTTEISSEDQLSQFFQTNHLVLVGLFDQSDDSRKSQAEFQHTCIHFEDVFCVNLKSTFAPTLAKLTNNPVITSFPAIAMVYDHDDKYALFTGEYNRDTIDNFVRGRRLLTVNVFQPGTIEYILDAGLPMLVLVSPQGADDAAQKTALKAVADKFLGQVVALTVGNAQPWEEKLCELLDVKEANRPVVRILNHPPSQHHDHDPVYQSQSIIRHGLKYRPQSDDLVDESSILFFVQSYISGQVQAYIRSEPEPTDQFETYTPGSILINAVGLNFDKLVADDITRDILVVFHAPWCGHCRKLMPTLRELGLKLGHTGKTLKIVKIDATRNEVPNVPVSGYPTIILFNAVDNRVPIHQRQSVSYSGDRTVEHFVSFLAENAVKKFTIDPPTDGSYSDDQAAYFEEL